MKTERSYLDALSRTLKSHEPVKLIPRESAAVAAIFRDEGKGEEVLLIKRAVRAADPWSGQVAFPGGRVSERDGSFEDTARRETMEEVGIDLSSAGASTFLGYMDASRSQTGAVTVVPCVFRLAWNAAVVLNEEVAAHEWVPLRELAAREARAPYRLRRGGVDIELPSFVYRGFTVWGLTERIVSVIIRASD